MLWGSPKRDMFYKKCYFYLRFSTLQLARKFFSILASVCHVFNHSLMGAKHMRALEAWLHVFSQVTCASFHFVCFRDLWSLSQHEVFFEDLIFKTRATFSVDQEHVTSKMKNNFSSPYLAPCSRNAPFHSLVEVVPSSHLHLGVRAGSASISSAAGELPNLTLLLCARSQHLRHRWSPLTFVMKTKSERW